MIVSNEKQKGTLGTLLKKVSDFTSPARLPLTKLGTVNSLSFFTVYMYGDVWIGILLSFVEAAILYVALNISPEEKQKNNGIYS